MKRLNRLENKGWKVVICSPQCGEPSAFASKLNGLRKIKGSSITDLHKQIFGY